jgi:hypothetical protein
VLLKLKEAASVGRDQADKHVDTEDANDENFVVVLDWKAAVDTTIKAAKKIVRIAVMVKALPRSLA